MISKRLSTLRKHHGYSLEKVGQSIGISGTAFRKYEVGHSYPSYETLIKIADFFNVPLDFLVGRTNIKDLESTNILMESDQFLKKIEQETLGEPLEIVNFSNSLEEAIHSYNYQNISEDEFNTLLKLLQETTHFFNDIVMLRSSNNYKDNNSKNIQLLNRYLTTVEDTNKLLHAVVVKFLNK